MKSSKAQIYSKIHRIPDIRFEKQHLTTFSGLLIFQVLFNRIKLKERLKRCFANMEASSCFAGYTVVLWLIIHLLLGFRRLREIEYYREDPIVLRVVGLRKSPDTSTISRRLAQMGIHEVEGFRALSRNIVMEGLEREQLRLLTVDFDGVVQSTKGHREGTAVGFNKKKKGARSYYPLFCTIAQTGQFFDVLHRAGNVHDSNGAPDFIRKCIERLWRQFPDATLESRLDSAFFNEKILTTLDGEGVRFTASVPFLRFPELKELVENRHLWIAINDRWSYFEADWKPASWDTGFRFIFVRQKVEKQIKAPLQLDLFEPRDHQYDFKLIVTNKSETADNIIEFHNGRGGQETIFGEGKTDAALGVLTCKRLCANQVYTLSSMMAHNLSRELQMQTQKPSRKNNLRRSPLWEFKKLSTIRRRLILKAGRLIRPQGKLTLSMNANKCVQNELLHILETLQKAA